MLVPGVTPPSGAQVELKHALVATTDGWHEPVALQVPPQAPSLHAVPLGATGLEQPPVPPSPLVHVPARWQESEATQVTGVPALQVPPWQVSPLAHALPLLQAVPFGAAGLLQAPVLGSHEPATEH